MKPGEVLPNSIARLRRSPVATAPPVYNPYRSEPATRSSGIKPVTQGSSRPSATSPGSVILRMEAPTGNPLLEGGLPSDIFLEVAQHLSTRDVKNLHLVSKAAKRTASVELSPTLVPEEPDSNTLRLPKQPGVEVHEVYGRREGQSNQEFFEYLDSYKKDADTARKHMMVLVQSYGKEGATGPETEADRQAAKIIARYNEKFGGATCAAVFYDPTQSKVLGVGANKKTDIPKLGMARLRTKYNGFELVNEGQCSFMHAEIRIWEKYVGNPNLVYIGIDKLCCLFCAAQLLAAGFTGFRGCHMNTYKQYTFSNRILSRRSWRRRLLGPTVDDKYAQWTAKERLDFLSVLANAPVTVNNDTTASSHDYASDSDDETYEKDPTYQATLKQAEVNPRKKRKKNY